MFKIQFNHAFNRDTLESILQFKYACLVQARVSPTLCIRARRAYTDKVYASNLDIATQDRLVIDFTYETRGLI